MCPIRCYWAQTWRWRVYQTKWRADRCHGNSLVFSIVGAAGLVKVLSLQLGYIGLSLFIGAQPSVDNSDSFLAYAFLCR